MDIGNLVNGLVAAFSIPNLLACFIGVLVGTIVGVLPGIGPVGAQALLLPFTFGLDAGTSVIMLSGIYYGSMYGGSTTSILLNVPGESASVVTCLDGYQMAKKGRAGAALAVAAIGSFIAGTVGVVGLMVFAPPLGQAALAFGPPEFLAISVLGMLLLNNLTGGSFLRSFLMFIVGLMVSTIGIDQLTGFNRLSFGILDLTRGIELLPFAMGLFGMAEIFAIAIEPYNVGELVKVKFKELYPNKSEMKRSVWPIFRGSCLGFPMGLIPGPASLLSSLISYRVEKGLSRKPEEFGKGAIEGVAGPESANNAAASGAMVPLLALGIPFAPATAILLGGLMIHGVTPGPLFIAQHNNLFWLVIASMYIGNLMLLVLNLPLVGVFASLTKLPARILMPIVTAIMFIGTYSINNNFFDLILLVIFGLLGIVLKNINYSAAPLIVGLVLGPVFEKGLRQSLMMADGNFWYLFQRPISGTLLGIAAVVIVWMVVNAIRKKAKTAVENGCSQA